MAARWPARGLSRAVAPLAAGTLAGIAAACAGGTLHAPQAEALAYMRAHPVPAAAGMTTGIVMSDDDEGFAGAAAAEARCPASLTAYTAGSVGSLPLCGAWDAVVETPDGRTVRIACGSIAGRVACPAWLNSASGYVPDAGDYIRFTSAGQVVTAADVQVLAWFAVDIPEPDNTAPFVVTPAGGAS